MSYKELQEKIAAREKELTRSMVNKALDRKLGKLEYVEIVKLSMLSRFENFTIEEFLELLSSKNKYEFLMRINWDIENLEGRIEGLEEDLDMLRGIIFYITGDKDVSKILAQHIPTFDRVKTLARLIHGLAQARPVDY